MTGFAGIESGCTARFYNLANVIPLLLDPGFLTGSHVFSLMSYLSVSSHVSPSVFFPGALFSLPFEYGVSRCESLWAHPSKILQNFSDVETKAFIKIWKLGSSFIGSFWHFFPFCNLPGACANVSDRVAGIWSWIPRCFSIPFSFHFSDCIVLIDTLFLICTGEPFGTFSLMLLCFASMSCQFSLRFCFPHSVRLGQTISLMPWVWLPLVLCTYLLTPASAVPVPCRVESDILSVTL